MTGKALVLLLDKLNVLAGMDDNLKIAILEQSILNSWQSVYELSAPNSRASPANRPKTFADLDEERFQRSMEKARAEDAARAQMEKSA